MWCLQLYHAKHGMVPLDVRNNQSKYNIAISGGRRPQDALIGLPDAILRFYGSHLGIQPLMQQTGRN